MLLALLCALQVAAATMPASSVSPLMVRVGDRVRAIAVVTKSGQQSIRVDQLVAALGGIFSDEGDGRLQMQLNDRKLTVLERAPYVIAGRDTLQLSSGVFRRAGVAYLPLSFATQTIPRLVATLRYDASKREMRRITSATAPRTESPRAESGNPKSPIPPTARPKLASTTASLRQRVVVVDAGHGGPDNGMSGPIGAPHKVKEKDITLAVAKALRTALERRGITVVMTRSTDTLIALSDRGKIANHSKGDLFLSVHVNAANPRWRDPGGARGYETYFLAEAKTEDEKRVEAMENEAIRFETTADASRDDPLGFIIRDMAQNEHLRESAQLAELMQRGLRRIHPGTDRGVKQAGFRVLVTAFMPAVLVEIGFGSNKADSSFMTDPDRQRDLAETLADAATSYFERYERKVGGTP